MVIQIQPSIQSSTQYSIQNFEVHLFVFYLDWVWGFAKSSRKQIVPIAFLTMAKNRLLHFQGVDTKAAEISKIWGAKSNWFAIDYVRISLWLPPMHGTRHPGWGSRFRWPCDGSFTFKSMQKKDLKQNEKTRQKILHIESQLYLSLFGKIYSLDCMMYCAMFVYD